MKHALEKKEIVDNNYGEELAVIKQPKNIYMIIGLIFIGLVAFVMYLRYIEGVIFVWANSGAEIPASVIIISGLIFGFVGIVIFISALLKNETIELYQFGLVLDGHWFSYYEIQDIQIVRGNMFIEIIVIAKTETKKISLIGLHPKNEKLLVEVSDFCHEGIVIEDEKSAV